MTDTVEATSPATAKSGLNAMLVGELKQLGASLGLKGTGAMRKGELIAAITSAQAGRTSEREERPRKAETAARRPRTSAQAAPETADRGQPAAESAESRSVDDVASRLEALKAADPARGSRGRRGNATEGDAAGEQSPVEQPRQQPPQRESQQRDSQQRDSQQRDDDDFGGGRRSRRRRNRDRQNRRRPGSGGGGTSGLERLDAEPVLSEDDVVTDISGILDVLDNYAFVRTTGYLPGPNDAYVSLSMVRKYGLRKGDIVTGAIKSPKGRSSTRWSGSTRSTPTTPPRRRIGWSSTSSPRSTRPSGCGWRPPR